MIYLVMGNFCDDTWVECACASEGIAEAMARDLNSIARNSYGYWVEPWEIIDRPASAEREFTFT